MDWRKFGRGRKLLREGLCALDRGLLVKERKSMPHILRTASWHAQLGTYPMLTLPHPEHAGHQIRRGNST